MKTKLLLLLFLYAPLLVSAGYYDVEIEGIYYKLNQEAKEATVVMGCTETYGELAFNNPKSVASYSGDVVIPESFTYNGISYTVTSIEGNVRGIDIITSYGAFEYCKDLTSITIPKTIRFIGYRAFVGCTSLKSVYISDLTAWCGINFEILDPHLSYVPKTNPLYFAHDLYLNGKKITNLIIPDDVEKIKAGAFIGCSISTITFHKAITSIDYKAFDECNGLTDVYCYSPCILTAESIAPPLSNVSSFVEHASKTLHIRERYKQQYIYDVEWKLFGTIKYIEGIDFDLLYKVDGEDYKSYIMEVGETIVPESAPTKEGYTFSGWSEIPETMPDHDLTIIGSFFPNTYKLTYTVDGEEFKVIEVKCDEDITPEPNPTRKGMTFSGWSEIPKKMPAKDVTVTGTFSWSKIIKDKIIYQVTDTLNNYSAVIGNENADGMITIASDVEFDNSYKVTSIADKAFNACKGITTIDIPATIINIGERAFANIDKLTDVTIYAENVPETDRTAFENSYIDYVTLRVPYSSVDKFKVVGPWRGFKEIVAIEGTQRTFVLTYKVDGEVYKTYEIKEGEKVTPEPAPEKEGYTFSGWSDIPTTMPSEDVVITGTFIQIEYDVDGSKFIINDGVAIVVDGGNAEGEVLIDATITINGKTYKVTIVGKSAYQGNSNITSVDIPDGIETILANAFLNCSSINKLKIGKSIKYIGSKAFGNIATSAVGRRAASNPLTIECHAESVPEAEADCFVGTSIANAVLLVEDSLIESYKAVAPWCYFGDIKGFNEASGIDAVFAGQQNAAIYSIDGQRLYAPQKGMNIIKTSQGIKKVIFK